MTLRLARTVLYAVIPLELLLVVLIASGVRPPFGVVVAAEAVVLAVLALELTVTARLFRGHRRGGLGPRAALRATYHDLVPEKVRRIMEFDLKGFTSLFYWVAGRRHGVPRGATQVSYAGGQMSMMIMMLFAMLVETVALELLLRALGVPLGIRLPILFLDLYGVLFGVGVLAASVTRPHVVTDDELRLRYGSFFDLRVPRELIVKARVTSNFNESGMIRMDGEALAVVVSSQTNVIVELTEPVTAVRPLGRRERVRTLRFYADDPKTALKALRTTRPEPLTPKLGEGVS